MDEASPARPRWQLALRSLSALFSVLLFPLLLYLVVRIFYRFPMNYNEGWNVAHTAKLLAGQPLYVPLDRFPLTPLNYPPLSFFIVGALSFFTGDILFTGRLVTVASSAIVSLLIYRIVANETRQRTAGVFAALFWLSLMTGLGRFRLVMHDPQMLAHAFSLAALWLFSERKAALTFRRVGLIGVFCCLALFVKHLAVVVPAVLAITFLFGNKRAFWNFAVAGVLSALAFAYASRRYGGEYFLSNFVDTSRATVDGQLRWWMKQIFLRHFVFVAFGFFFALLASGWKRWSPYLLYFCLSFALGVYSARGIGVDINAWFDFFIAAAILVGIFAGSGEFVSLAPQKSRWKKVAVYGILLSALLPMLAALGGRLTTALNYDRLKRSQSAYERQVELLRSIPGPTLSEVLLLAFDAGKEFLYDPFAATQLMRSGRMSENILTDAIRRKSFGAIVFESNPERTMCGLRTPESLITQRWSLGTLRAVNEHYALLDGDHSPYYFYVPRRIEAKPGTLCPTERSSPR